MIYTLNADHEEDNDYVEDYDEVEVWGPSRPQLPPLDFAFRTLWPLRSCDPLNGD